MYELLQRCIEQDDPQSWEELWTLYFDVVRGVVRRLLRDRYCEHDVDDVLMTIAVDLLQDHRDKLRSFRGNSRGELCRWLLRVAVNATLKWMDANRRRERKFRCSVVHTRNRAPGPTEEEVRLKIKEIEQDASAINPGVSRKDAWRLRVLAGLEVADSPPSDRTVRQWTRQLLPRVTRLI